jgi:hypothetical protein
VGLARFGDALVGPLETRGYVRRVLSAWSGAPLELNAVFARGPVQAPKVRAFVDFLIERLNVEETIWGSGSFLHALCEREAAAGLA